jgi:hypothetical protein
MSYPCPQGGERERRERWCRNSEKGDERERNSVGIMKV